MANILDSLKRQIEILAFFYVKPDNKVFTSDDLAEKYFVSKITINRDLNYLRSLGISINSTHNKGIGITGKISDKILSDLILKYFALYNSEFILSKAFDFIKIKGMNALHLISTIDNCIYKNNYAMLEINTPKLGERSLKIVPCKIVDNDGNFELIFVHNNIVESVQLKDIVRAVELSEQNIADYKNKVKEYLSTNYNKQASSLKIKLQVSSEESIHNFAINDIQLIKYDDNGTAVVEISGTSLDDIALWAIIHSDKVKIMEPKSLIDKIKDIAEKAKESIRYEKRVSKYDEQVAESKGPERKYSMSYRNNLFSPIEEWNIEPPKPVKPRKTTIGTIELSLPSEYYF